MIKQQIYFSALFLAFALSFTPVKAQAEGKGFYPDGQLKWEYLFEDGEISEAKWYNEAGQLVSRESYAAGEPVKTEGYRLDGTLEWQVRQLDDNRQDITRFDENGLITTRYQTLDGQPDGEHTTFYTDDSADTSGEPRMKQSVTYRQGVLEGPARAFFPSGQVEHEFAYRDGKVDGVHRTYSEEGTLLSEYTFKAGQLQ